MKATRGVWEEHISEKKEVLIFDWQQNNHAAFISYPTVSILDGT